MSSPTKICPRCGEPGASGDLTHFCVFPEETTATARLDGGLACDLAELVYLTREVGWATKRHWQDIRGGCPEAAAMHWQRLLRRLDAARIPHRSRLLPTTVKWRDQYATMLVRAVSVEFGPQDIDSVIRDPGAFRVDALQDEMPTFHNASANATLPCTLRSSPRRTRSLLSVPA